MNGKPEWLFFEPELKPELSGDAQGTRRGRLEDGIARGFDSRGRENIHRPVDRHGAEDSTGGIDFHRYVHRNLTADTGTRLRVQDGSNEANGFRGPRGSCISNLHLTLFD
ncbi:MAG: hypothetical protein ACRD8O_02160, partial [Bryobacteraceae bacterium]